MDVQKYLADWRSAIGQGSDLATSIFGGLGNQAGQVLTEATKAGIPISSGCCPLAPDVAKLITINMNASICDMWVKNGGGEKIAAYLEDKGDSDPSYAIFTGPAGNAFAAVWQPCVQGSHGGGWCRAGVRRHHRMDSAGHREGCGRADRIRREA